MAGSPPSRQEPRARDAARAGLVMLSPSKLGAFSFDQGGLQQNMYQAGGAFLVNPLH